MDRSAAAPVSSGILLAGGGLERTKPGGEPVHRTFRECGRALHIYSFPPARRGFLGRAHGLVLNVFPSSCPGGASNRVGLSQFVTNAAGEKDGYVLILFA